MMSEPGLLTRANASVGEVELGRPKKEPPVMLVSDVHYEHDHHHGVWEGGALEWLLKMVRASRPAHLVALGDLGHAWTASNWETLGELVRVSAIYGNHDALDVLRRATNRDGTRILAEDGETRWIGDLKFGFVNGIIAKRGSVLVKDGVPRQSPDSFASAARRLSGADVLCTHASPYLPEYGKLYHPSEEFEVLDKVIREVDPALSVSGHLSGPFTFSRLGRTAILRIDSSPLERHYALLDPGRRIRVMHDYDVVAEGDFLKADPSPA